MDELDSNMTLEETVRLQRAAFVAPARAYGVLLDLLVVGTGSRIEIRGFVDVDLQHLGVPVVSVQHWFHS